MVVLAETGKSRRRTKFALGDLNLQTLTACIVQAPIPIGLLGDRNLRIGVFRSTTLKR